MAHVAAWKKEVVEDLKTDMVSHTVVAIVNVRGSRPPNCSR